MNGVHDLGGMHGLGPIVREENEPIFHAEWERRVFGMFAGTFVFAGYSVDEFRHAIENIDPAHYFESTYYEHWLHAFEDILIRRGFVTREEYDARIAEFVKKGGK